MIRYAKASARVRIWPKLLCHCRFHPESGWEHSGRLRVPLSDGRLAWPQMAQRRCRPAGHHLDAVGTIGAQQQTPFAFGRCKVIQGPRQFCTRGTKPTEAIWRGFRFARLAALHTSTAFAGGCRETSEGVPVLRSGADDRFNDEGTRKALALSGTRFPDGPDFTGVNTARSADESERPA